MKYYGSGHSLAAMAIILAVLLLVSLIKGRVVSLLRILFGVLNHFCSFCVFFISLSLELSMCDMVRRSLHPELRYRLFRYFVKELIEVLVSHAVIDLTFLRIDDVRLGGRSNVAQRVVVFSPIIFHS